MVREQVFDRVTEALDADAEFVPRGGAVGALRAGVQVACFVDALDREALRGEREVAVELALEDRLRWEPPAEQLR